MDSNFAVFWYGVLAFFIMFIPSAWLYIFFKRKLYDGRFRKPMLIITFGFLGCIFFVSALGETKELLSVQRREPTTAQVLDVSIKLHLSRVNYKVVINDSTHKYYGEKLFLSSYAHHERGDTITVHVSDDGEVAVTSLLEKLMIVLVYAGMTFLWIIAIIETASKTRHVKPRKPGHKES